MDFQFGASQPVMEEPFRPTVFMGREIAVDRDDIPDFTFDADTGADFSDSDPGEDADAVRAFNQEVLGDVRGAPEHDEDVGWDGDSGVAAIPNEAVNLLKQHQVAAAEEQSSSSDNEDIPVNDAPESEAADAEIASALPASPAKKPAKPPAKGPAKKAAKKAAKSIAKASETTSPKPPAKPAAKAGPRKPHKTKKELPLEKPTRISDRISKPRARAAAIASTQPISAAPKPKATKRKTATKVANNRKTSGQQWEVEFIVDSMIDADTHQHFYQVKWKGFSNKDNTWEPKINLANCQAAIRQFEGGSSKRGRRKSS